MPAFFKPVKRGAELILKNINEFSDKIWHRHQYGNQLFLEGLTDFDEENRIFRKESYKNL